MPDLSQISIWISGNLVSSYITLLSELILWLDIVHGRKVEEEFIHLRKLTQIKFIFSVIRLRKFASASTRFHCKFNDFMFSSSDHIAVSGYFPFNPILLIDLGIFTVPCRMRRKMKHQRRSLWTVASASNSCPGWTFVNCQMSAHTWTLANKFFNT